MFSMKFKQQESSTLELKREIPKNDQIIKTMVGFCNQYGGKLIVGIDDDGTVIGVSEDQVEKVREYLEKSVHEATAPSILPSVYTQLIGDKLILIIEVGPGMNKPYYVRSEGLEKGVYIRLGRTTLRAHADMIEELRWQSRGREFDKMAVYRATEKDLDKKEIREFLAQRKNKQKSKVKLSEAMLSYHLMVTEHAQQYPTTAGILLFGNETQHFFEHAMIMCGHFKGISGRDAIASKDCVGNLIDQYHTAYDFIVNRLNKSFTITGKVREEILEIPEVAIREILINAIVHRNYHTPSPIKIALYENRLEIYSPGNFAGPIVQYGLLSGSTFWRNPAICKVFRELGLIELMGSGFLELFKSYKERGLDTPQIIEGEGFIKCILPRPSIKQSLRKGKINTKPADEYKPILDLFTQATEITISDIISLLHIPRSTAGRRVSDMIKKGLLSKMGKGKGTRYFEDKMF